MTPVQGPLWRKTIQSPLLPVCIPIAPERLACWPLQNWETAGLPFTEDRLDGGHFPL